MNKDKSAAAPQIKDAGEPSAVRAGDPAPATGTSRRERALQSKNEVTEKLMAVVDLQSMAGRMEAVCDDIRSGRISGGDRPFKLMALCDRLGIDAALPLDDIVARFDEELPGIRQDIADGMAELNGLMGSYSEQVSQMG